MPFLVLLVVLVGILSGVVYGTNHWQQFGNSIVEAAFWGGAIGASVSAAFVILLSLFHSFGKGLEWFFKATLRPRFWFGALMGTLIACSFVNLILSGIAFGKDPNGKWNSTKIAAQKLFQDLLVIDWTMWFEGFSVLWPLYLFASLLVGSIAIVISLDIPESERMPWYVSLLALLALTVTAFPPTLVFALYAYIALIVVMFVVMVILLVYFASMGSPEFFLQLHRKPFRFGVFYSAIGGASGTYVAVYTSLLGAQAANSPPMIATGFAAGAIIALLVAMALRRAFGLQWDPMFT
jgi:hypothetical protein